MCVLGGEGNRLANTDIAEFIVYKGATIGIQSRIETYLSEKYNIALAPKACGDLGYHSADANKDCTVDIQDFAAMASEWLKCTEPYVPGCDIVEPF